MRFEIACVVPARLGSTRFPGKMLVPLFGKPLVVHTLDRATEANCFSEVICFTDSEEIGKTVQRYGYRYCLTEKARNGTERIAHNLSQLSSKLVVNLQGDEPVFPIAGLTQLCKGLQANPEYLHTLIESTHPSLEDLLNPNRVKALVDANEFILDFFRGKSVHAKSASMRFHLHLGAYAYSSELLKRYAKIEPSSRELEESHEMLRDLSLAPIKAHFSASGSPVDVPEDLEKVQNQLEALRSLQGVLS